MTVKIRLSRGGAKKRPFYRVVVADERNPRDGRYLEKVGIYNVMLSKDNIHRVIFKVDRIKYWLSQGAKPTERVERLLAKQSLVKEPNFPDRPIRSKPKFKTLERLKNKKDKSKV